jgi:type I restriction enzyme R subunit
LGGFTDDEQEFEDYKQVFRLVRKVKQEKTKTSILDDIDFELELIHRDQINVNILKLLAQLKEKN